MKADRESPPHDGAGSQTPFSMKLAALGTGGEDLEWVTPDDFLVKLSSADPGARLAAFMIDFAILAAVTVAVYLLSLIAAVFFGISEGSGVFIALAVLFHFFFWNGYWIYFEWRKMGMTPGKKAMGIQVIGLDREALSLSSVVVRNIAREVEVWLPAWILILGAGAFQTDLVWFLWCLPLLAIPLINGKRRRAGDFLAGTCVVKRPEWPELPRDLLKRSTWNENGNEFEFTIPMLEVYGTTQLNALQELLEGHFSGGAGVGSVAELVKVKSKIVAKTGYPSAVADSQAREFLLAFYKAMRGHMESQLASGRSTLKTLKKTSDSTPVNSPWLKRFEPPE